MATEEFSSKVESFRERFRKNRRLKRISAVVAVCLACVATVALVIPAVTLEYAKPACGMEEHEHSDDCMELTLTCDVAEGMAHVHTPACYNPETLELVCEKPATGHMHVAACLDETGDLVCGETETVHIHMPECFDANGKLVCESDVAHVHGATCYTLVEQPAADAVTAVEGENAEAVEAVEDIEAAAATIPPTTSEYVLTCTDKSSGHVHNITCLDEAGNVVCNQDEEVLVEHKHADECYEQVIVCGQEEHIHTDLCYDEINKEVMKDKERHELEDAEFTDTEELDPEDLELTEGEADLTEDEIAEAEDQGLLYENDALIIAFDVPEDIKDDIKLKVTENEDKKAVSSSNSGKLFSNSIHDVNDAVHDDGEEQTSDGADEASYEISLNIEATLDGEVVKDISDLGITAKLQMKANVIEPMLAEIDLNEVAEELKNEVGVELVITQESSESASSVSLSNQQEVQVDEVLVTSVNNAAATVDVVASTFSTSTVSAPNPLFTVNYKADVKVPVLSNSGTLEIINTSNGGKGSGSKMPENGKDPTISKLALNSDGTVKTNTQFKKIYTSDTYKYFAKPTLTHINKVEKADNYWLKTISVTSNGDTTNYTYDKINFKNNFHFTNKEGSAGSYTKDGQTHVNVLITDNTIIDLIYGMSDGNPEFPATFYDYNISSGKSGDYYLTEQRGINSAGNYTGTGTKLAFGNKNAGTGLGTLQWGSDELNKYNNNGYSGCTFKLASKLDSPVNGKIVYSSGVIAPKLFDEGAATGKTQYGNSKLTFYRYGDTFTLSKATVNSNSISNLNKFGHPGSYTSIWTNNFWPLDNVSTTDPKFGGSTSYKFKNNAGTSTGTFPASDDGRAHNSYFGMQYKVPFEVTADYCGPLEYLFFGDDDLWVFLDDKLVVDIGGVHSSVGEYVNLWDHIKMGEASSHTLSIYYTERGASGSTCFMNFTLPSVSSVEKDQDRGSVQIRKEVIAPDGSSDLDKEFEFSISLTDSKDEKLLEEYSYTRHYTDGSEESGLISNDEDEDNFRLKNGEYIVIDYLPIGSKYTVQEVLAADGSDPYYVNWQYFTDSSLADQSANGSGIGQSPEAFVGQVSENSKDAILMYTNTAAHILPDTGGIGDYWFWIGGGSFLLLALLGIGVRRKQAVATASRTSTTQLSRSDKSELKVKTSSHSVLGGGND